MNLLVAPNGATTVRLESVADLTGWSVRLAIIAGNTAEFEEALDGTGSASFTVPPSLIGRRFELSAIGPDLEPDVAASGAIVADSAPGVNVIPFEPAVPPAPFETYVHEQLAPASTWVITHSLGRHPSVVVEDSGGTQVHGDVTYLDENTVQLDFSVPFGGRADIGG